MPLNVDQILDRRRLKRKLTFWRLFTIAVAVVAVAVVSGRSGGGLVGENHVARLNVSGLILEDYERDEALKKVAEDNTAKALVVYINSPGGTVVGGEALYHKLKDVGEKKPVITLMGGVAASAGYMTALAAEYIFAREGTVTGSIGVLMQTADMTELLAKIGVKPESVKSHPLKAQPNPLEPFTPEAREATKDVVMDLFNMFVDLVAERRKMDRAEAMKLSDGRIFTGRQALENGLVDAIGGEPEARKWLAEAHKIPESIPMKNVEIKRKSLFWSDILDLTVGKTLFSERLTLDGLISLWQPDVR